MTTKDTPENPYDRTEVETTWGNAPPSSRWGYEAARRMRPSSFIR